MIVVELSFTHTPERIAARAAHRERLATLHANGQLLAAGPWSDDSGALQVFDVVVETVEQIIAADPYYTTPGVAVRAVREWAPVVGR